jgi:hypothetical protein
MDTIRDLFSFMLKRKKYWLLPAIIVLVSIGVLLTMTTGSAVAPFIYTVF